MAKFSIIPREEKFFDLIEVGLANMVRTAEALKDLVDDWTNIQEKVLKIVELEHAGDSVTHQIIAMLHRSFVTPFDRKTSPTSRRFDGRRCRFYPFGGRLYDAL